MIKSTEKVEAISGNVNREKNTEKYDDTRVEIEESENRELVFEAGEKVVAPTIG